MFKKMKGTIIYIICVVILSFIITQYIVYPIPSKHQSQCDDIYEQKPIYKEYKIIPNFINHRDCDIIMQEGEDYASKHGWTTKRHADYPTTDNKLTPSWKIYKDLKKKVHTKIFPQMEDKFMLKKNKLWIDEMFIAKYDGNSANAQKSLEAHEDGSEFSFIIALNDDFFGGGTRFIEKQETVKLKKGDAIIFCGQTKHAGVAVTSGVRYILTGFINYGHCIQNDKTI